MYSKIIREIITYISYIPTWDFYVLQNTHTHTHTYTYTHISHNCDPHTTTVNLMAKHNYNKYNLSSDLPSYYNPINTSRGPLYLIMFI